MQATFIMLCPNCQHKTPTNSQLLLLDHNALWHGHDLRLTKSEMDILRTLVLSAGRFTSYRALYDVLHYPGFLAGAHGNGHMINMRSFMKRLRNRFKRIDPAFCSIVNANRIGYMWREEFIPTVKEKESGKRTGPDQAAGGVAPDQADTVTMLAVGA